jgi:hypothetical protein
MDLIRNEEDEQRLEDDLGETGNNNDEEGPVVEPRYELSKDEIDDKQENENSHHDYEEETGDADLAEIEEDLQMIDSDFDK